MHFPALQPVIDDIKTHWILWLWFASCVISAIHPRWLWNAGGESWKFRDGVKPEPSTAWLWSTRITSIVTGSLVFVFLRYAKPAP